MMISVKAIIPLIISLFIHILILQFRFDAGPFQSTHVQTTEVGLVEVALPGGTLPTSGAATTQITRTSDIDNTEKKVQQTPEVDKPGLSDFLGNTEIFPTTHETEESGFFPKPEEERQETRTAQTVRQDHVEAVSAIKSEKDSSQIIVEQKIETSVQEKKGEGLSSNVEVVDTASSPVAATVVASINNRESEKMLIGESSSFANKKKSSVIQRAFPRYETNPDPQYPDIALRKGWEGLVLLRVDVKKNGTVESVTIEESSGFKSLDRAALKAVRRWQFVPAMYAGLPADGAAMVPINFDLP